MKELELRELSGELINVAEIEKLLSQYFHSIRQVLRSIPASSYVELFESIDAIELKTRLQEKIDESLEGIGMFKYEYENEINEAVEEDSEDNITTKETESGRVGRE